MDNWEVSVTFHAPFPKKEPGVALELERYFESRGKRWLTIWILGLWLIQKNMRRQWMADCLDIRFGPAGVIQIRHLVSHKGGGRILER